MLVQQVAVLTKRNSKNSTLTLSVRKGCLNYFEHMRLLWCMGMFCGLCFFLLLNARRPFRGSVPSLLIAAQSILLPTESVKRAPPKRFMRTPTCVQVAKRVVFQTKGVSLASQHRWRPLVSLTRNQPPVAQGHPSNCLLVGSQKWFQSQTGCPFLFCRGHNRCDWDPKIEQRGAV